MTVYSLEDMASHVYVVLKGRVKILRTSADGQQKILSIRYRGELFGELALAGGAVETRRSDEAVALDTTRVAMIRVSDFWNAARRDPALMQNAMQYVAKQLAEAHRQIESLVFENNHRRLARALIDLANDATRAGEASVRLTHEEVGRTDRFHPRSRDWNDDRISPAWLNRIQARRHSTKPGAADTFSGRKRNIVRQIMKV
jgi:CRP/FNR family transcriptional regulator